MTRLKSIGRRLAELPGGRRTKFAVIAVWLVVLFAIGPLAGKFEDAQENDPADYLPANAESVQAIEQLDGFPSDDQADAITVFHRDAGLTAEDKVAIERTRTAINERVRTEINAEHTGTVAETGPAQISADGSTALLTTPITVPEEASGEAEDLLTDTPEEIKTELESLPSGLEAKVTGPAGFAADAVEVFNDINGTLLYATAALVLLLLIIIYRSPIFWTIPFFSVLIAEVTTRGLGYLIAEAGVTVTGQSGGILPVLVFGAGTDYALLMVSRYREELRRHEDKHDAIRVALRRTSPVILASGGTVMAALLTLSLAEVTGTSGLGPIGAMGIAMAMLTMLTILPALLTVFGRRAFWPFIPRLGTHGADVTHGVWRRIADWVARAPRRVWVGTTAVLAVMIVGLAFLNSDLTTGNMFRDEVDSVQGQELLEVGFPAGANAPTNVLVTDPSKVDAVHTAVAEAPGVAEVSSQAERGPAGAKLEVTLEEDPYSTDGFDLIPAIRDAAGEVAGDAVLVGGPTAEEYDLRQSAARDNRLIVPIALVVVFLILAALLRAIMAPLVLIATVIVSYFAALGIGAFFFENVFDFPGMGPDLPLFAFIFLVALGIDYNIFLMARVREEALTHGTRDGMIRGLAVTGAVITSAGLVLAGTFSTLAVLPLVFLTEIGFVIAVGVLIDTFLVRSLLVPALVLDIGDRVWWPSALAHGVQRGREEHAAGGIAVEELSAQTTHRGRGHGRACKEETMSAKKAKQKSAESTTANNKKSKGFTDEERAAMKERAQELKAAARRGPRAGKADEEGAVLARIAEMPKPDRAMAKRLHAIVKASAPALSPKSWYGMPAYADDDGKVVCFFQSADKFKSRYATLGFSDKANLDKGAMWPTSFALKELTAAEEAKIGALVKKAVS